MIHESAPPTPTATGPLPLREHLAAGRLTTGEFDDRLDKAYAAKSLGELDELMADLPAAGLSRCQTPRFPRRGHPGLAASRSARRDWAGQAPPAWRAAWGSMAHHQPCPGCDLADQHPSGGPWFLWVVQPWGVVISF